MVRPPPPLFKWGSIGHCSVKFSTGNNVSSSNLYDELPRVVRFGVVPHGGRTTAEIQPRRDNDDEHPVQMFIYHDET